jgi:hypothetical protein
MSSTHLGIQPGFLRHVLDDRRLMAGERCFYEIEALVEQRLARSPRPQDG